MKSFVNSYHEIIYEFRVMIYEFRVISWIQIWLSDQAVSIHINEFIWWFVLLIYDYQIIFKYISWIYLWIHSCKEYCELRNHGWIPMYEFTHEIMVEIIYLISIRIHLFLFCRGILYTHSKQQCPLLCSQLTASPEGMRLLSSSLSQPKAAALLLHYCYCRGLLLLTGGRGWRGGPVKHITDVLH